MTLDVKNHFCDAIYRQLRIDPAEFINDAFRVDGICGGPEGIEHIHTDPLTVVLEP